MKAVPGPLVQIGEGRKDTRAGSYDRHLQTRAGEVTLTAPKLRSLPFKTAIIERYRRRESPVEEALIEMYLAGVSVRRVEDITQALWGTRVSASTVSDLNQKIYGKINEWREWPLVGDFPCAYLDGLWLKRSWGGEVKNVSVLVAIGQGRGDRRERHRREIELLRVTTPCRRSTGAVCAPTTRWKG